MWHEPEAKPVSSDERFYTPRQMSGRLGSSSEDGDDTWASPRSSARSDPSDEFYGTPRAPSEKSPRLGAPLRPEAKFGGTTYGNADQQPAPYAPGPSGYGGRPPRHQPAEPKDNNAGVMMMMTTMGAQGGGGGGSTGWAAAKDEAQWPAASKSELDSSVDDVFSYARHNRIEDLDRLLMRGLPPDVRDVHGNTILIVAGQNGHKRVAKAALRRGSDINAANYRGNTCLHYCFFYGFDDLGKYLISKGADPSIRNNSDLSCYEGLSR